MFEIKFWKILTNKSGFTAFPAGYRVYDGFFVTIRIITDFWTSSYPVENKAIFCELIFQSPNVTIRSEDKRSGFSVRCVKD